MLRPSPPADRPRTWSESMLLARKETTSVARALPACRHCRKVHLHGIVQPVACRLCGQAAHCLQAMPGLSSIQAATKPGTSEPQGLGTPCVQTARGGMLSPATAAEQACAARSDAQGQAQQPGLWLAPEAAWERQSGPANHTCTTRHEGILQQVRHICSLRSSYNLQLPDAQSSLSGVQQS